MENETGENRPSPLGDRHLSLPRLMLIADGFTATDVADRTVAAARGGVPWVQLRDHRASREAFAESARDLTNRLLAENPDVLVSINTRANVAKALGSGMHVGKRGPSVAAARAHVKAAPLGFSAHNLQDARRALQNGADYVSFSPIFPTSSKPGHPGTGLATLRNVCTSVSLPVLALGGIAPERVMSCLDAGAHGVAVLSGILRADDPAQAVHRYFEALEKSQTQNRK